MNFLVKLLVEFYVLLLLLMTAESDGRENFTIRDFLCMHTC